MSKKIILGCVLVFSLILALLIVNFDSIGRFVDISLYSNYYHYKNCLELPSYEISKKEFEVKKEKIIEFLGTKDLQISENNYSNGFIQIRLIQTCDTKAQLEIDILSDDQRAKVQEFLQKELPTIPANIRNG